MNLKHVFTLLSMAAVLTAWYPASAESAEKGTPGLAALYADNPHAMALLRLAPVQLASPRPEASGLAGLYARNAHIRDLLQPKETPAPDKLLGAR